MVTSPATRLRRRVLLGIPALVAAASTVAAATPTTARAAKRVECLADLIQEP